MAFYTLWLDRKLGKIAVEVDEPHAIRRVELTFTVGGASERVGWVVTQGTEAPLAEALEQAARLLRTQGGKWDWRWSAVSEPKVVAP